MERRVIVIGAGIAGLAAAYRVREQARRKDIDLDLTVFEAGPQAGGKIHSERDGAWLCETGPNGFLDTEPATLRLVEDLGLQDVLQRSNEQARRRFIVRHGRRMELSMNPRVFLKSGLMSRRAKWRMACEPFIPRRRARIDESVAAFGRRRLGREFTEVMLDSLVSGIYAGDPERISAQAAFPKLCQLEADHGGLLKGMLARRKANRERKKTGGGRASTGALHSFREGMAQPLQALEELLGPTVIRRSTPVLNVLREGPVWRVELSSGHTREADAIIMATPAPVSAGLLRQSIPDAAHALEEIPIAGIHVVCLGFHEAQIEADTNAFGLLIPRSEGIRTLGAIYSSGTFEGRAPQNKVLLTCMIGGRRDPEADTLEDQELRQQVLADLRPLLGITGEPSFERVFRWARGIPQYELGHLDRVRAANEACATHGGVFLAGNSVAGVSFNECVAHAEDLGEQVTEYLLAPAPAFHAGR